MRLIFWDSYKSSFPLKMVTQAYYLSVSKTSKLIGHFTSTETSENNLSAFNMCK